jgi:hypothetical protein
MGISNGRRWYARTPRVAEEFADQLAEGRASLHDGLDGVAASIEWLDLLSPHKTFNRRHTSYGYKHYVERYFRHVKGQPRYVSNGAFIAAAIGMGFRIDEIAIDHPNVHVNIAERDLKRVMRECAE